MINNQRRFLQRGGVSIFIVIFTALLVTIVTASFAQLMVRNQQQASATDLSQSAYDSALAGVEDAKRALVKMQEYENNGQDALADQIRDALDSQKCDSLGTPGAGVVTFKDGEVMVGKAEQNQAYSCVKVQLDTPDFKDDSVSPGVPTVVPLKSKSPFNSVRISWFTKTDLDKASSYTGVETASFPANNGLLPSNGDDENGWPAYAPALMRAQLIQFQKGNISLKEFNKKGTPDARTLFLYPYNFGGSTPGQRQFSVDTRRSTKDQNKPTLATCNDTFNEFNGYACQVEIVLPSVGGGTREAYLQLQTYYQQYTSFKVELVGDGGSIVNLNEVQPSVDSTGRASSLFRRVQANVSLRNDGVSLPYPDAALSVSGDLCKNYFITHKSAQYKTRPCGEANPTE